MHVHWNRRWCAEVGGDRNKKAGGLQKNCLFLLLQRTLRSDPCYKIKLRRLLLIFFPSMLKISVFWWKMTSDSCGSCFWIQLFYSKNLLLFQTLVSWNLQSEWKFDSFVRKCDSWKGRLLSVFLWLKEQTTTVFRNVLIHRYSFPAPNNWFML